MVKGEGVRCPFSSDATVRCWMWSPSAGCAVDGVLPDETRDTEPISIGERKAPFVLGFCLGSAGAVNSKK
jgi:hypothetical protein